MASPVDTSVKFFRDDFPGAPSLTIAAGSAISVLDACLVTGFGARTATSLVVLGGVATLTLSTDANNGNLLYSVILVSGATGSWTDLNGEQRTTLASSTTLSFATALPDGTATGTISVKTAPAGWEKSFTGTNMAAYKSLDVTSLGMYLQVDDSTTTGCGVKGFETMSDVSTGTGSFPTGSGFWIKGTVPAGTKPWDVFADTRALYFCPVIGAVPNSAAYWFGDVIPFKSGDAFAASLSYSVSISTSTATTGHVFYGGQGGAAFARSYVGVGTAVSASASPTTGAQTGSWSGADATLGSFPPPTDGALRLSQIQAKEGTVLRGVMPGVKYAPQTDTKTYFDRGTTSVAGGRRHTSVKVGNAWNSGTDTVGGRGFVDITGPWR